MYMYKVDPVGLQSVPKQGGVVLSQAKASQVPRLMSRYMVQNQSRVAQLSEVLSGGTVYQSADLNVHAGPKQVTTSLTSGNKIDERSRCSKRKIIIYIPCLCGVKFDVCILVASYLYVDSFVIVNKCNITLRVTMRYTFVYVSIILHS